MSNLLKRKKYKRLLYSKPILLVLLVIFALVAQATWNMYKKERETRKNLAQAQAELEELDNRADVLQNELTLLGTQKGIEAEIREKFGVAKEGENVIIIVDREGQGEEAQEEQKSIWEKIRTWLHF